MVFKVMFLLQVRVSLLIGEYYVNIYGRISHLFVSVCGNGSILGAESVSLSFRRKRKSSLQAPADSSGYFTFSDIFLKAYSFLFILNYLKGHCLSC